MNRITVVVEGGIIQDISDIPEGIEILVKDYDCDEEEEGIDSNVKIDEDGNSYWQSIWGKK